MAPAVGRIVEYRIDEHEVRPAMIVRVFTPECVNLQVFVDGVNDLGPCPKFNGEEGRRGLAWRTSVKRGDGPGEWNVQPAGLLPER
jgi:hypothetical protein